MQYFHFNYERLATHAHTTLDTVYHVINRIADRETDLRVQDAGIFLDNMPNLQRVNLPAQDNSWEGAKLVRIPVRRSLQVCTSQWLACGAVSNSERAEEAHDVGITDARFVQQQGLEDLAARRRNSLDSLENLRVAEEANLATALGVVTELHVQRRLLGLSSRASRHPQLQTRLAEAPPHLLCSRTKADVATRQMYKSVLKTHSRTKLHRAACHVIDQSFENEMLCADAQVCLYVIRSEKLRIDFSHPCEYSHVL